MKVHNVQFLPHREHITSVISGFRRGVNEIFALLGCYAE